MRRLWIGIASGAAGTAALNIATYVDMAIRARPASELPAKDVGKLADEAGIALSEAGGESEKAKNRRSALGALMGYLTGLGVGGLYGVAGRPLRSLPLPVAASVLGAAAMAGSDGTSTLLGMTDPRKWTAKEWAADVVPHLAYGIATAAAFEAFAD